MKNIITKIAFALSLVLFAAACKENKPVIEPVFPQMQTLMASAGQSVDVVFDANLDWSLTIDGEGVGTWFGIDDNGMLETKVSGTAGEDRKVTIKFSDETDFEDRVCSVMLTMAEKSQEIAKITRLRADRKLTIYTAVADEYSFKKEGESYVYSDQAAESLELITFPGDLTYTVPVKIESNFSWMLNTGSDFVTASVVESTGDVTETVLSLTCDQSIANGSTVELKFLTSADADAFSIPVALTIPAFGNRMEIQSNEEFTFNKQGQLKQALGYVDQPAVMYLRAAEGARVVALEWNAEQEWFETSFASWIHTEMNYKEGESGFLRNITAMTSVDLNEGAARQAVLLALPYTMANLDVDALLNASGTEIKAEYEDYIACIINQDGIKPAFISVDETADNYKYTFAEADPDKYGWVSGEYGAEQVYHLTFSDQYSSCSLVLNQPYASFDVRDYDNNLKNEDNTFWMSVSEFGGKKQNVAVWMDDPGEQNPVAFVIFYDANDNAMGVLICEYNTNPGGGSGTSDNLFSLASGTGKVTKLAAGNEEFDMLKMNFNIDEIYEVAISSHKARIEGTKEYFNLAAMDANGSAIENFTEFRPEPVDEKSLDITIDETVQAGSYIYLLYYERVCDHPYCYEPECQKVFAIVKVMYDPEAGSGAEAPISFAYPSLVQNATLELCSDELYQTVKGEFGNFDRENVYQLVYKGEAMNATLKVPGAPTWGLAYHDEVGDGRYWLSCEMEGSDKMSVYMTKKNEVDFFIWKKSEMDYMPYLILVCTAIDE